MPTLTYYEELAVAQNASQEEIRQAYRVLARLLHPDNQPDPKLKSVAERQMVRLNEILAILTDEESRRKYDGSIAQNLPGFKPEFDQERPSPRLLRQWPWGVAACIVFVAGSWYFRSNASAGPAGDHPITSVNVPDPPEHQDRREVTRTVGKRRPSVQPPGIAPGTSAERAISVFDPGKNTEGAQELKHGAEAPEELSVPEVVNETAKAQALPPPVAHILAPAAEAPDEKTFGGRWIYAPRAGEPHTPNMYPPEFIELFLFENGDALTGKYWARYRVPDKAVSPEVKFRIFGSLSNPSTSGLEWVADDGAQGKCKIMLIEPNSIEVNWWTSVLGRRTVFTSGTAVLIRQRKQ